MKSINNLMSERFRMGNCSVHGSYQAIKIKRPPKDGGTGEYLFYCPHCETQIDRDKNIELYAKLKIQCLHPDTQRKLEVIPIATNVNEHRSVCRLCNVTISKHNGTRWIDNITEERISEIRNAYEKIDDKYRQDKKEVYRQYEVKQLTSEEMR